MNNKLISIVVPVYNIEGYIEDTVNSILSQTHKNMEIILVDDGSSDGTGEIIDKLSEKHCQIMALHKPNGGVTSARLYGIEHASGDYIGFVDGDDYIEPDMFEHLLKNASKHNADISHCGYQMVFPDRIDYYYNTGNLVLQDKTCGLKDLISGAFIEPGLWNKLYKKELFQNISKLMDKEIRINEDLLMNFYLFKNADLSVFEDFCPYHYMIRAGSAATSKINEHKLKDPLKVLGTIYNQVSDCTVLRSAALERILRQMIFVATMTLKGQPEFIKPYRDRIRKELRTNITKVLSQSGVNTKMKIMALWTAVWPWSYSFVHGIHSKITGTDRKYDIN